ncbi:MAG: hypothetical protein LBV72_18800 [Tannerella sp.]|nr:hypothetical protein [Tannerella sp.]
MEIYLHKNFLTADPGGYSGRIEALRSVTGFVNRKDLLKKCILPGTISHRLSRNAHAMLHCWRKDCDSSVAEVATLLSQPLRKKNGFNGDAPKAGTFKQNIIINFND